MREYDVTLVLAGDPPCQPIHDALAAAGCRDVLVRRTDGETFAVLRIDAESMERARRKAITLAEAVPGVQVEAIEPSYKIYK